MLQFGKIGRFSAQSPIRPNTANFAAARQEEISLRRAKQDLGSYHDDCNGLYFLFEEKSRGTHF